MNIIQNGKDVDWQQFHRMDPEDRIQFVNDEGRYPILFQEMTNYVMEKVRPLKKEERYMRIWGNSVICDTIVNSSLQECDKFDNVF